ncbi:hypothetical protein [Phytoactinopolyspora halotolerans]|uniref:Uncharacterized protein n=1 Tax=Phytoactinopolyspora halotolerans TaxID=1981512 RepID=A0A6L9S4L9_9ACTN|nr:hypothetical protein [Phytoactinopolyspora halotolerans]NED98969.1 hypothetical protein [Phytoactinopolyspora halotolerans]
MTSQFADESGMSFSRPATLARRKPGQTPLPKIAPETLAADARARREVADRTGEVLDRLRRL